MPAARSLLWLPVVVILARRAAAIRKVSSESARAVQAEAEGEASGCTASGRDPWASGRRVGCCAGLQECLGQWDGSGRHHYQCRSSCSAGGGGGGSTGPTCQSQWNNRACTGQFGNQECHTCGERINWLRSQGQSENAARERVAMEFFGECGACHPGGVNGGIALMENGYSIVWRDDFNGNGGVDRSRWHLVHSHGNGFGNNELQFYTDRTRDNSWVADGSLKIRARREDFGGRRFTSAKMESTGPGWLYGKFSIRARIPGRARGTWPAIWMMPRESRYGRWPHSGEIDIMEHVGYDPNVVHGTVHTGAFHHSIGTQIGGSTRVDVAQWHVYTMEWRPDIILFAVDNRVYQIFRKRSDRTAEWPFNQRFYLIMNMAVGGDWGGSRGIDEPPFRGEGQILEVDWVRVEQRRW